MSGQSACSGALSVCQALNPPSIAARGQDWTREQGREGQGPGTVIARAEALLLVVEISRFLCVSFVLGYALSQPSPGRLAGAANGEACVQKPLTRVRASVGRHAFSSRCAHH